MATTFTTSRGIEYCALGELASFVNGYAFKPTDWEDSGLPIIRIQNLTGTQDKYNRTTKSVADKYYISDGDLLISWSASLGAYIWDGGDAVLNQHIFKAEPNEGVEKDYLYFAVQHVLDVIKTKTHGSTMKHVKRGDFEGTHVPLPSITGQRRIIDILKRADGIRRLRRQAWDAASQLIPSLFIDMFGDPVTNPKGWVMKPLREVLSSIDSGWSPKCDSHSAVKQKWGVLKLSAVTYGEFREQENKELPAGIEPKTSLEVQAGDVLFARKNTKNLIAATALVMQTRPKLMLSDLIFRLQIADRKVLMPEYLWGVLSNHSKRSEIQNLATGAASSMPNISKKKLMAVEIPVAPIGLQNKFAAHLENSHSILRQQKIAGLTAESSFQSLLNQAFSETNRC